MGARGRKSKASMTAVPTALPQRPAPPASLNEAGKKRWKEIVDERLVDFFSSSDLPLIEALILTEQIVARCDKDIRKRGVLVKGARSKEIVRNPAVALRKEHVKTMLDIQTKLRLCPSTRYRAEDAKLGKRPGRGGGKKPWEA